MKEIKVRKPRPIKFYGFAEIYYRYKKRQDNFFASLPSIGDHINATWLPDNGGQKNAYIGFQGIVKDVCNINGDVEVFSGSSTLCINGSFNYEILPANTLYH